MYFVTIARGNLLLTQKSRMTMDEQVHLALRWSIANTTESQSENANKIWNDSNKVGHLLYSS